jgi:hypothetical protein
MLAALINKERRDRMPKMYSVSEEKNQAFTEQPDKKTEK